MKDRVLNDEGDVLTFVERDEVLRELMDLELLLEVEPSNLRDQSIKIET